MSITTSPNKTKSKPDDAKDRANRVVYRAWRDAVSAELQEREHYDEAERWDYCDTSPRHIINRNKPDLPPTADNVWVCSKSSEHDTVLFSPTCDYRFCPDCAHRHTARLLRRYVPAIEEQITKNPNYRLRTLTLTRSVTLGTRGFGETANKGFQLIQKLMAEVVGPNWNKKGAGLLANWEVGPNGLKLHYHMVYLGPWVDQKLLSKTWQKLTGGDRVVWVKAVLKNDGDWQGAVMETLKYATKFYTEDKATKERKYLSPALTVDLFEAMKGTRRIRSWGSFYSLEKQEDRAFCCSHCDAKMVKIAIGYYELWRLQDFSEDAWRLAIKKSLLQYRIADKYTDITKNKNRLHPKSTRLLPFMDEMPEKKSTHYDYE